MKSFNAILESKDIGHYLLWCCLKCYARWFLLLSLDESYIVIQVTAIG